MPIPTADPKVLLKDLIKNNWNAANTSGVTPDFHTGWHNPHSKSEQITFTGKHETFEGRSGYGAIEGGGGGPVQIVDGKVFVNLWATRDEGAGGANPKKLVYQFEREVRRILLANFGSVDTLDYVSILMANEQPAEGKPLTQRTAITLGYKWRTT